MPSQFYSHRYFNQSTLDTKRIRPPIGRDPFRDLLNEARRDITTGIRNNSNTRAAARTAEELLRFARGLVTRASAEMVGHYFTGNGTTRTLTSFGIGDNYRRHPSVQRATRSMQNQLSRMIIQDAERFKARHCQRATNNPPRARPVTRVFSFKQSTKVNSDPQLMAIDNSQNFRLSGTYDLNINCERGTFDVRITGLFRLRDFFKDPLDVLDGIPGNIEIVGGRPYELTELWPFNTTLRAQRTSGFRL